jgi:hypothetical protein
MNLTSGPSRKYFQIYLNLLARLGSIFMVTVFLMNKRQVLRKFTILSRSLGMNVCHEPRNLHFTTQFCQEKHLGLYLSGRPRHLKWSPDV